jgi:hypothetical protein
MNDHTDINRIKFLLERDTLEEVIYFARQCIKVYKGVALGSKRKFGRHHTFRVAYIRSYLFHKRWLEEYDHAL